MLSCLLAVAVVGTVVGILKYRKVSKTADNVNSLVNDGKKVAGEIGEEFSKIKQTIEETISNLDDITDETTPINP